MKYVLKYAIYTINIFALDAALNIIYNKNFRRVSYIFFLSIFKWVTQNDTGSSLSFKVLICCTYVIKRTVVCILSISKLQNYVCLLTALEALFVPFQSTGNPLFCSVNGFATFRAFWMFHGLERHFYTEKEKLCYRISYFTETSQNYSSSCQVKKLL